MKTILALLILAVFCGSPVWISMAILIVPQRWWFIDVLLCGLQALMAYAWWWFWWGGGIGAEAHPSTTSQWMCLLGILPIAIAGAKHVILLRTR